MYPALAKELSEAHCKAIIGFVIRIDFDAKISASQSDRISCEFLWVCIAEGEAPLGDCTVIDFECGLPIRHVLISEIDLMELESPFWTRV